MTHLRRISVSSMAKMMAALSFFIGAVIAVIVWLFGSLIQSTDASSGMFAFGTMMLVALPLLYGALGMISGALFAGIYNMVAGWTGGLELELQDPGVQ